MTRRLPRLLMMLTLALPIAPVSAAEPDAREIAQLVKQLGDDQFAKREAATARLKEIGEPALDALARAKASEDPEVRRRADEIVADIHAKVYVEQLCLKSPEGQVFGVCASADGKRVLTIHEERTLRLWDVETGKCLCVFTGHTDQINGAALSPDGKRVLSGSNDRTLRLWDAENGKELLRRTGNSEKSVLSVVFRSNDQALSGSNDGTVQLWDLQTGKNTGVYVSEKGVVNSVAYHAGAGLAATGGHDQTIRVRDLDTDKEVRTLVGHGGQKIVSLCFSADGKRLLSASYNDGLRLWDVATGKELTRIKHRGVVSAALSPDGKRIVIAASGGRGIYPLSVWDAETGKELHKYQGHTDAVVGVAFFPDGRRFASASRDGTARVWRAPR
jgi:WD40 repeat protein